MKTKGQTYDRMLPLRRAFLHEHGIQPDDTTLLNVTYETDDFCRYVTLTDEDRGDGIVEIATIEADALVVTEPGHAILLPLADCLGAVIHDPLQSILMVAHLGRHSLEQVGGTNCIDYLVAHHDVNPSTLKVWFSPSAGAELYPLFAFDNRSLQNVAAEQLVAAGVLRSNIALSPIDSSTDENYFSHSQYLKGNRVEDGRFAIVAALTSD